MTSRWRAGGRQRSFNLMTLGVWKCWGILLYSRPISVDSVLPCVPSGLVGMAWYSLVVVVGVGQKRGKDLIRWGYLSDRQIEISGQVVVGNGKGFYHRRTVMGLGYKTSSSSLSSATQNSLLQALPRPKTPTSRPTPTHPPWCNQGPRPSRAHAHSQIPPSDRPHWSGVSDVRSALLRNRETISSFPISAGSESGALPMWSGLLADARALEEEHDHV